MMQQKLVGLTAVVAGLVSIPLLGNDATVAFLFIPAGLFLFFSKRDYIW